MTSSPMPFKHRNLHNILLQIYTRSQSRHLFKFLDPLPGRQFMIHQIDHTHLRSGLWKFQILDLNRLHMERMEHPALDFFIPDLRHIFPLSQFRHHVPGFRHQPASPVHLFHPKTFQILKNHQIRLIPRSHSTHAFQSKILRRIQGAHFHRLHWICTIPYGFPDDTVNMTISPQFSRMFIIRHQHSPLIVRCFKHWHQFFQIFSCRSLSHHDPLASGEFLLRLLKCGTLMIRLHASCNIRIQSFARKHRRMAIDQLPMISGHFQFLHTFRISRYHTVRIHHFRQSQYPWIVIKCFQIRSAKHSSCLIKSCRRHTGRHHKIYIQS